MAEQNLNTASCTAVEQKSRASFICCSFSHFRTLFVMIGNGLRLSKTVDHGGNRSAQLVALLAF
jgi:hypothetical protein